MLTQPLVSIIIVNYNGKNFLFSCIDTVCKSNYSNFEILLIDNASTDGSIDLIREKFSNQTSLKIITSSSNLGFTGGNNLGLRKAKGKYLILLNSDTIVDKNWLQEIVTVMESDSSICAAQPKLLYMKNTLFDSAGGLIDRFGHPLVRGLLEYDCGQYDQVIDVFFGKGAALVLRRNVLAKVGLLDDTFFLYNEEIDLCWRIVLNGNRVVFIPKSVVFHIGEGSSSKSRTKNELYYRRSTYLMEKNNLRTLLKNYTLVSFLFVAPQYFGFLFFQIFFFLIRGRLAFVTAELRALAWNFVFFPSTWIEHLKVNRIRVIPDNIIKKRMYKGLVRISLFKLINQTI